MTITCTDSLLCAESPFFITVKLQIRIISTWTWQAQLRTTRSMIPKSCPASCRCSSWQTLRVFEQADDDQHHVTRCASVLSTTGGELGSVGDMGRSVVLWLTHILRERRGERRAWLRIFWVQMSWENNLNMLERLLVRGKSRIRISMFTSSLNNYLTFVIPRRRWVILLLCSWSPLLMLAAGLEIYWIRMLCIQYMS